MPGDKWYFSSPSFLTMKCPCFSPGRGIIWQGRHSRSKRNYFLRFGVLNSSRAAEYLIEMEWVEKMVRHADFWAGPLNDTGYWARIGKTTRGPAVAEQKGNASLLLMLLFLGTLDVHRRDWRALVRRMRLLRLDHKRQKMRVLQMK